MVTRRGRLLVTTQVPRQAHPLWFCEKGRCIKKNCAADFKDPGLDEECKAVP